MPSLALYQPDQAGNVGTLLRLSACLQIRLHIIHPCGFSFSDQSIKRSAMDYIDHADYRSHDDIHSFWEETSPSRKILLTTKAENNYTNIKFMPDDILLLGRESAGVPEEIHQRVDESIKIPLYGKMRSLNIAMAGSMILGEAMRQTNAF